MPIDLNVQVLANGLAVNDDHPMPVNIIDGEGALGDNISANTVALGLGTTALGLNTAALGNLVAPKGTAQTLFGGAISASVAETDATVIDMTKYKGGSLEFTRTSGTGTFSLVVMTHETGTGVFVQMDKEKADGSGVEDYPAIVTTASTSKSYSISRIRANYLKFVPTLSGTCTGTFKFTPSVD